MANSIGKGFPTTNLQIGHIFADLDENAYWKYIGGDPKLITSWTLVNGTFSVQPDTTLWGMNQAGSMWFYIPDRTFYGWDGFQIIRIAFRGGESFFDFKRTFAIQDDFLMGRNASALVGNTGWTAGAGSATVIGQPSEENAPGIFQLTTTTTINTVARLTFNGSFVVFITPQTELVSIQRTNHVDSDTTIRIGFGNATNANPPNHGIYFEKLTGDTNWFAVSRSSAVETRTDTGIAAQTASFVKFKISAIAESASVKFYIDNVLVATHTTNLPIETIQVSPFYQIINAVAAAKTIDIDYFHLIQDRLLR